MTWMTRFRGKEIALVCAIALILQPGVHAQWLQGNLKDTLNQADYILITPPQYVQAIVPLASYRASNNGYSVAIVLLDSIRAQFPSAAADSAMRAFLTYTLSAWRQPHPSLILLVGNVNTIPSHKTESPFHLIGEDSVLSDQWFVDELSPQTPTPVPQAAIGRFPAWDANDLNGMVSKTLAYEQTARGNWEERTLALADSEEGDVFEYCALTAQTVLSAVWSDTTTVHVRTSSPLYRSPADFRAIWNQGVAIVDFVGKGLLSQFSPTSYFVASDVALLTPSPTLPLVVMYCSQRFDTVSIASELIRQPQRGAVCVVAPLGMVYYAFNRSVVDRFFQTMTGNPELPIGIVLMTVKQANTDFSTGRMTLLGDPALVVRHGPIASVKPNDKTILSAFALDQNFPNPFNPTTGIRYQVSAASHVKLAVYDILGREVAVLVNEQKQPGAYEVRFDGSRLASGIYVYRLTAGSTVLSRKMALLR